MPQKPSLPQDASDGAARLHAALVDEVARRLGARRVVLLRQQPSGQLLPASARLQRGEDAAALIARIKPWLDEDLRNGLTHLRHGPDGVPPREQRSCLIAPLMASGRSLGCLYADVEGRFGRFEDAQRDMAAALVSQAAQALEALEAAQGRLAQREGELALIHSIQQGIAAKLDFQGIVDLVGDKLVKLFATDTLVIAWLDEPAGLLRLPYGVERGRRLHVAPMRIADVLLGRRWYATMLARAPVLWSNQEDYRAQELLVAQGTEMSRSGLAVPIFSGERLLGFISVENRDRESAFGEAELRLLSTVAASMGNALQNARLFDETQRLLKETEQRNAELAVINSVQQGIAGSFDFKAIVELVGDKLCEVLHTRDISIRWWDEEANVTYPVYVVEHGVRLYLEPQAPAPGGITERILRGRESFIAGTEAERMALGVGV